MLTRRNFAAQFGIAAAVARMSTEAAFAQRARVNFSDLPKDAVWLNANENPLGPPDVAMTAMRDVLPTAGRYHFQEFGDFYGTLARSEGFEPSNLVAGAGSSEVLCTAVEAFTSPTRPLITAMPTYELPVELARALGHKLVLKKLHKGYTPNVSELVDAAKDAGGGLIYLCNPNNPTSTITRRADLKWLVEHLPANTQLLVDEAYIHFAESPEIESALPYVTQDKDVIVTRTFSKIFGMAGLRAGFGIAPERLISRMRPLISGVISIVSARGVLAAVAQQGEIVPARRTALARTRRELCAWLTEREVPYLEPHANFVMLNVGRPAIEFIEQMPRLGVVVGRPFPPLDNMLRVTLGTDTEMAKFRTAFWKIYRG